MLLIYAFPNAKTNLTVVLAAIPCSAFPVLPIYQYRIIAFAKDYSIKNLAAYPMGVMPGAVVIHPWFFNLRAITSPV